MIKLFVDIRKCLFWKSEVLRPEGVPRTLLESGHQPEENGLNRYANKANCELRISKIQIRCFKKLIVVERDLASDGSLGTRNVIILD